VIVTLAAVALVVGVTEWLVPAVIRSAYAGESLGLLNGLISGRDRHPVESYLDTWRATARPAAAAAILLLVIVAASRAMPGPRNPLRRLIGGRTELSATQVVLLSAWFGAIAGILEAGFFTGRHVLRHLIADRYYAEVLWMGPLSAALAFALVGTLLALLAAMSGMRWGARSLSVPLLVATAWSLLQSEGIRLYPVARVALALGVAVAVSRSIRAHPGGFLRLARWSGLVLGPLLFVASAIGIAGLRPGAAPGAAPDAARDAPAAASPRPNVLLLILDTVRAANTSLHGYGRATTPEIEAWATDGVTFEHAVSTAPWTLPSHATLFTGLYHASLGTSPSHPLGPEPRTLAETLGGLGYRTGGFVANDAYTTRASGLDRGFGTYRDLEMGVSRFAASSWSARGLSWFSRALIGIPAEPASKTAETVRTEFLSWLDADPGAPFFAFLNFFDAHSPYVSPPAYMNRFGPPAQSRLESRVYDPEELRGWLNAYDGAIAYIDHEIGRIRRALEVRGLLDHTLVIITSDHGEQWGEHGLSEHGGSLYIPTLHVPLVLSLPGALPRGVRVAEGVSLRDLPATVLDLVDPAGDHPLPGASLVGAVADGGARRSASFSEVDRWEWTEAWRPTARGDMKSLVEWPFHYIRYGDGEVALFDVDADPAEETDLSVVERSRAERMGAVADSVLRRAAETGGERP